MPLQATCVSCHRYYQAADDAAGKTIRCPHCQTVQTLPRPAGPPPLPAPRPVAAAPPAPAAARGPTVVPTLQPPPLPARPAAPARAVAPLASPVRQPAPVSASPAPTAGLLPRSTRPRWLLVAGLGTLAVLAVGVVVWLASSGSRRADDPRDRAHHRAADSRPAPDSSAASGALKPRKQPASKLLPLPPIKDEPIDPNAPLVFVQVHSWDQLIGSVKRVARAAGQEQPLRQLLLAPLRQGFGQEGFPGVEGQKPWGAYVQVSADLKSWAVVGLVPVNDRERFRATTLPALGFLKQKTEGDVELFRSQHPQFRLPEPLALRFAHGYAYLTLAGQRQALGKGKRVPPRKLFADRDGKDIFASLRLDRLPRAWRARARRQLRELRKAVPQASSKVVQEWVDKVAEVLVRYSNDLLDGGRDLSFGLAVNPATQAIEAELALRGKEKSALAANLAALAQTPSLFGALAGKDAAFSAQVNLRLPHELRQRLPALVAEATEQVLRGVNNPREFKEAERLFRALGPTFAAGELDCGLVLHRPKKGAPASLSGGLKVVNGKQLDRLFQDLVAELPDKNDRDLFHLRALRLAGVAVHRHDWYKAFGGTLREALGDNPNYYAFRPDALFWAGGAQGKDVLAEALRGRPRKGPLVQLLGALKPLIELAPVQPEDRPLARTVLDDRHPGRFRLALEAGSALRLRVGLELAVVRFVADRLVQVRWQGKQP